MSSVSPLRSWYAATLDEFLAADPETILGSLARNSGFNISTAQRDAWHYEIELLRDCTQGMNGYIFLEFIIPRLGGRVDAIVIIAGTIFVLEFKVGAHCANVADLNQVWDYALDLKNFHEGSHRQPIVPILIPTESKEHAVTGLKVSDDGVAEPVSVSSTDLRRVMHLGLSLASDITPIVPLAWARSSYRPTPTIIEAARALYARHSVAEISRSDAGATNLRVTAGRIGSLIEKARTESLKVICFVTGVPGAGKTLVGLDVATQRSEAASTTHAVFLSGNGPLVAVLREALARDEVNRRKFLGERIRKGAVTTRVKAFIQNVHHFRDEALIDDVAPDDRVAIFDEAQRAWNKHQTATFMRRRKNRPDFNESEPEFLIRYMDRHPDWAVIICLVGGGQEINTGEAGISAWLEAVHDHFPRWKVFMSPNLSESEYGAQDRISVIHARHQMTLDADLHLAVSMRSFRAENVSAFVKALLDCDVPGATNHLGKLAGRFPIVVTRSIAAAKRWIRSRARGSERYGLVASSKAMRLKPHAIDVRVPIDPVHWFLNEPADPRASYYLEDAATEFQVQGLELDWVCMTWDADLRKIKDGWSFHDFRGAKWTNVQNANNRSYLKNAYRVLLTRARQGMVLFIPPGDSSDPTRLPDYYDETFQYLASLGMQVLEG